MNPSLLHLLTLGLRHIAEVSDPTERADILEAAATALELTEPVLSERARTTAAMIRSAEDTQKTFHDLLSPNTP